MIYSTTVEKGLVVPTMKKVVKRRFLVIPDGNPLGSPIPSFLLLVREFVVMWSGFMKRSSIQEEDFESHGLVVFWNIFFVRESIGVADSCGCSGCQERRVTTIVVTVYVIVADGVGSYLVRLLVGTQRLVGRITVAFRLSGSDSVGVGL